MPFLSRPVNMVYQTVNSNKASPRSSLKKCRGDFAAKADLLVFRLYPERQLQFSKLLGMEPYTKLPKILIKPIQ
ncbi:hypothetical protein CEXT_521791 [Caerostris extrusa]|uniref:Uncharacterized protein n=1 Tax=Caerostris extrusa TaxID=172846 RepID=A0AAV4VAD9_CAEEX|nr:hypothetical protein CEXT_521791 [Caerostris extrusa]